MARTQRNVRRTLRLIGWAAAALCSFYALFGGEYPIHTLFRLRMEQKEREVQVVHLRAEVDSLRGMRDRLDSDIVLIEGIAREEFGLVREDEVLYRFVESNPGEPQEP